MSRKRIWITSLLFCTILLYFIVDPGKVDFLLQCPLYKTTGIYCPGCGTQRALHYVVHGEFMQAISSNLLFMLALVAGAFYLIITKIKSKNKRPHDTTFKNKWLIGALVGLVILFWILRNTAYSIGVWLAP